MCKSDFNLKDAECEMENFGYQESCEDYLKEFLFKNINDNSGRSKLIKAIISCLAERSKEDFQKYFFNVLNKKIKKKRGELDCLNAEVEKRIDELNYL